MAHVINTINSGGQTVILGDSFTPPNSSLPGTNHLFGSIRYNPNSADLEILLPRAQDGVAVWSAVGAKTVPATGQFYADNGATILRFNDRVLVGDASVNPALSNRDATPTDRLSAALKNTAIGAWPVYGAQMASGAVQGSLGILGYSLTADAAQATATLGYVPSSIGVAAFAVSNDTSKPTTTTAYAFYGHTMRFPGADYQPSFAMELEVANYGGPALGTSHPYHPNVGGGMYALQIGSGGGDAGTSDTEAGITFVSNPRRARIGILFASDSLVGTDGASNEDASHAGTAIAMARNHLLSWFTPDGSLAAFHRSTITDHTQGSRIEHQDGAVVFLDATGGETLAILNGGNVVIPKPGASIEIGAFMTANTPFIDFHSSGSNSDFDARIQVTGGTFTNGQADLNFLAGRVLLNGAPLTGGGSSFNGTYVASSATAAPSSGIVLTAGNVTDNAHPGVNGGSVGITGGTSDGDNGFGGAVTLTGGVGSSTGGDVLLAGGGTTGDGNGGTGGNVTIRSGAPVVATQSAVNSGSIAISTPNGGSGGSSGGGSGNITIATGTSYQGGTPGSISLQIGNVTDSSGANRNGGTINLTTGSGGPTNSNGGNLYLTLGAGKGSGNGGLVIINTLPIADPGIGNALWSRQGIVMSSGAPSQPGLTYNQITVDNHGLIYSGTFVAAPIVTLSSLVGATATNSISSGDNAQTWQWQLSSPSEAALTLTESTASTNAAASSNSFLNNTQYLLGLVTVPGSTAGPLRIAVKSADTLVVHSDGALIYQPPALASSTGAAAALSLISAASTTGTASSGTVLIRTGDSAYQVGDLTVLGGLGTSGTTKGGTVLLIGGDSTSSGTGNGGDVTIRGGTGQSGGGVTIQSGSSYAGTTFAPFPISISTPSLVGPTGSIALSTGQAFNGGNAGSISLQGGKSTQNALAGSITLVAGDQVSSGTFTYTSPGGSISLKSGSAGQSSGNGGDVTVLLGQAGTGGSGRDGQFCILGQGLPGTDPQVPGALWSSNGFVMSSGRHASIYGGTFNQVVIDNYGIIRSATYIQPGAANIPSVLNGIIQISSGGSGGYYDSQNTSETFTPSIINLNGNATQSSNVGVSIVGKNHGYQSGYGYGGNVYIQGGNADQGFAGSVTLKAGTANTTAFGQEGGITLFTDTTTAPGSGIVISTGNGFGNPGSNTSGVAPILLKGGDLASNNGTFYAGYAGTVTVQAGSALYANGGSGGDIVLGLGTMVNGVRNGQMIIQSLPHTDPGVANAVWASNGVLAQSGSTYYPPGVTSTANTANKLTSARTIALSGDAAGSALFDGSANATISATLAATGVTPGTLYSVVVDAKGRVLGGSSSPSSGSTASSADHLTSARRIALAGDAAGFVSFDGSADATITATLAASGVAAGTLYTVVVDTKGRVIGGTTSPNNGVAAATAASLATPRTIALAGDATGSVQFDGSANATIAATLAATGVTAGTFTSVVVNAKGLVTFGGTAPSSLSALSPLRNFVHNASFTINERSVSTGSMTNVTVSAGFPVDRWQHFDNGNGSRSLTQISLTDADRAAIGEDCFRYALRIQTTGAATAAGDYDFVSQRLEGVHTLAGKTVTMSYWAKAAVAGQVVAPEMSQYFGSGGSPSADVYLPLGQQPLTTSWVRYTVTTTLPSTAGKTLGTDENDFTGLNFWTSANTASATRASSIGVQSSDISITGVQIELGGNVTPFERTPIAIDFENCRRFFQVTNVYIYTTTYSNNQVVTASIYLGTRMRSFPSATITSSGGSGTLTQIYVGPLSPYVLIFQGIQPTSNSVSYYATVAVSADL